MQAQQLSTPAARNLNPSGPPTSISEGPGLAHDAGNLLGALNLYCDLLTMPGVLRPEHLHYARELRLLSQRSGVLINRLLNNHQTAIASVVGVSSKTSCPAKVVRAFTPLLCSLAAPDATVSTAVASGLPNLPFAAEVLERILVNLTRNAAAALGTRPPTDGSRNPIMGHIHIGISGNGTRLRLTVIDNGPGMTPAVVAAFMKPAALAPGALSGLGRHVIHDLVQSTGGKLTITAAPKRGTTVQIDWPISAKALRTKPLSKPGLNTDQHLQLLSNFSEAPQRKGARLHA